MLSAERDGVEFIATVRIMVENIKLDLKISVPGANGHNPKNSKMGNYLYFLKNAVIVLSGIFFEHMFYSGFLLPPKYKVNIQVKSWLRL